MDPLFMLEAVGFRATSGNQVETINDLGVDGLCARWKLNPSQQDAAEFNAWAATKLNADVTGHMQRPNGPPGLEQSRQAYAAWKKNRSRS